MDAVTAFVNQLRSGAAVLHAGVVPLKDAAAYSQGALGAGAAGRAAKDGARPRPDTAATGGVASSNFSYGSDLQADLWFRRGQLDMGFMGKLVVAALAALHRQQRWAALCDVGSAWQAATEGAFAEKVLPYLLQVRGHARDGGAGHVCLWCREESMDHHHCGMRVHKQGLVRTTTKPRLRMEMATRDTCSCAAGGCLNRAPLWRCAGTP